MSRPPVVIIGSGLAGYTVAREFRKLDGEAPLVMLSSDHGGFYSKPMLSNAFAQKKDADALLGKSSVQMAQELKLDIRALLTNSARLRRIGFSISGFRANLLPKRGSGPARSTRGGSHAL